MWSPNAPAGSTSTKTPHPTWTAEPTSNAPEVLREVRRPGRLCDRGASSLQLGREGLAVEDDGHPGVPACLDDADRNVVELPVQDVPAVRGRCHERVFEFPEARGHTHVLASD